LPFAVTGPGDLQLSPDRTGTTTFTVTNLTGRPVRVRLQPKSSTAEHDAWYSVAGDPEVPMTVGATITVDVRAKVPAGAPAGQDSVHLRAVDEADPELVTDGQPVAVAIPAAPEAPKKSPFVLIAIIALVVLLVGGGAIWWFIIRKPAPDISVTRVADPVITGQVLVGAVLTTTTGTWENATSTDVQWFSCTTPTACTPIAGATGMAFQITGSQMGTQLKVTVTAMGATTMATADSALTTVVRTGVPNVATLNVTGAKAVLAGYGLTATVVNDATGSGCSIVLSQSPGLGALASKGDVVKLTVEYRPPKACVLVSATFKATVMATAYIPIPTKT
jgi:hypothetical protein